MNSVGKDGAAHALREELLQAFVDRYYPAPAQHLPTAATAKAHGAAMAGHYVSSRAGGFNFLRLASLLGQTSAAVDKDDNLIVSTITGPSGTPRKWREVRPWVWQDTEGSDYLQANTDSAGHVKMFSITPYAPIIEFVPAPATLNAGWLLPVGGAALLIMLIAALGWPIVALVRRRYKYQSEVSGRPLLLHRVTRATAWLFILLVIGWVVALQSVNNDLSALNGGLDMPIWYDNETVWDWYMRRFTGAQEQPADARRLSELSIEDLMKVDVITGTLLLLGAGFLVANARLVLELLRFRRRRTGAILVWRSPPSVRT